MVAMILTFLLLFVKEALSTKSELFSSSDSIGKLAEVENELNNKISDYLQQLNQQIETLDNFLNENYANYNLEELKEDEYISNPVNVYSLLKRTSHEWVNVRDVFLNETSEKTFREISELLSTLPSSKDVEGAVNGLFLLQDVYDLDIDLFSRGILSSQGKILNGREKGSSLRASDMEFVGKVAFKHEFYDRAYEWLTSALTKAMNDNESQETISRIQSEIKTVIKYHDLVLETKGSPRGPSWKTFVTPLDSKLASKKKYKKALKENHGDKSYRMKPKLFVDLKEYELTDQFKALCRGEDVSDHRFDRMLKCTHLHFNDPYLRLGPFHLETLNSIPYVGMYHNFLHDTEIEAYKAHARPRLERSQHSGKNKANEISFQRTSKQTWFNEQEKNEQNNTMSRIGRKVSHRIRLATKFEVMSHKGGEEYQIANYGIGGVYTTHSDSLGSNQRDEIEKEGNRLATVMAYLSDVEAGGSTVFPALGISIPPSKGSAVVWFNMDSNGNQHSIVAHGGCPVLSGSKWITNKWVRAFEQWRNFPCFLDYEGWSNVMRPLDNHYCRDRCDY